MIKLKGWFERIIQQQFAKKGLQLGWFTQKEKVLTLIRSLHPVQTEYEMIRMGPASDGSYLVPNDLIGTKAGFCPGVS